MFSIGCLRIVNGQILPLNLQVKKMLVLCNSKLTLKIVRFIGIKIKIV
jgi:hypothetical protein